MRSIENDVIFFPRWWADQPHGGVDRLAQGCNGGGSCYMITCEIITGGKIHVQCIVEAVLQRT